MSCHLIHYVHAHHDLFFKTMEKFDALVVRCNPGQIKDNGGDQNKFDGFMRAEAATFAALNHPNIVRFFGAAFDPRSLSRPHMQERICAPFTMHTFLTIRSVSMVNLTFVC